MTSYGSSGSGSSGLPVEIWDSFALLLLLGLTSVTIVCAYVLESHHVKYLHETFVAMAMGAVVGLIIHFTGSTQMSNLVKFDPELFFFLLLPPIIFNCGYDLKRRNFFKNFAAIVLYAFVGTAISAFVFGFLVYGVVKMDVESTPLGVMDCLVFGALISATDTVAVIAIFVNMRVEPQLFALVFGESVLNDAVAIVIYETMRGFKFADVITAVDVLAAFGSFLLVFAGSLMIGVFFACTSALVYKYTHMRDFPHLESGLFVMFAYASYLLAQGIGASGIVSMMFCGIVMAHYTYENLSLKSQQTTKYLFQTVSFISDNFIFTYLGITIFAREGFQYYPFFIFGSLVALLTSRAASIFPLSLLLNYGINRKKPQLYISIENQTMLWWAGLRGGMAFALAMKLDEGGDNSVAEIIITTTLMLVVITICCFGGMTAFFLERLKIPVGVRDDEDDPAAAVPAPVVSKDPSKQHWFQGFDKKYLRPIFMVPKKDYSRFNEHVTFAAPSAAPVVQAIELENHQVVTVIPDASTNGSDHRAGAYASLQDEEDIEDAASK